MPIADLEERRAYQREWRRRRRQAWLRENGPCVQCGSSQDLQVDHIDPKTKLYETRELWSRRKEVREAELAKCQVLCEPCHMEKSSAENVVRLSRDETCKKGHEYAVVGRVKNNSSKNGACAECKRIAQRRRRVNGS